jgi:hypothetical protein
VGPRVGLDAIEKSVVVAVLKLKPGICRAGRSWWLRGLRHELSLLARTLGSWVQIKLRSWMPVCAFILCLSRPVYR